MVTAEISNVAMTLGSMVEERQAGALLGTAIGIGAGVRVGDEVSSIAMGGTNPSSFTDKTIDVGARAGTAVGLAIASQMVPSNPVVQAALLLGAFGSGASAATNAASAALEFAQSKSGGTTVTQTTRPRQYSSARLVNP